MERLCRASQSRLLEAALGNGVSEAHHCSQPQRRRLVRPGRFRRPHAHLRDAGADRHRSPELLRRRAVEPRRLDGRERTQAGRHRLGKRHLALLSRAHLRAVVRALAARQAARRSRRRSLSRPDRTSGRATTSGRQLKELAIESSTFTRMASCRSMPPAEQDAFDSYVSDPANPVPYRHRPVTPTYPNPTWTTWLVEDQRFVEHRPGRADVGDGSADGGHHGHGRHRRRPVCGDQRQRQRLGGEADRRLSRGLPEDQRRRGRRRMPARC